MPHSRKNESADGRPDFMVVLGLAPPYAAEDVKVAYRNRAKELHPDHGGSVSEFNKLQEAFEKAQQYLEFRGDRRKWIANQMSDYLLLGEVIDQLESFGAEVTSDAIDWLKQSFGDFAQLTETITAIRLVDSAAVDEMIAYMVEKKHVLEQLTCIELPGCKVSDQAVLDLENFQQLQHLDLSRTPITKEALWIVDTVLGLESINIEGTKIGWWTRRKVRAVMNRRQETRPAKPF